MERYPFYSCNSTRLTGLVELSIAKLEEVSSSVVDPGVTFFIIFWFSTFSDGNALILPIYVKDH